MGMTSLVLVILAVSVRAVSWADAALRRREERRAADEANQSDATIAADSEPEETHEPDPRARAAAIAVALALSQQSQRRGALVDQTPTSAPVGAVHDAWLTEGRARQRARRGAAGSARDRR